ncbi:MAG TPA: ABC transporter ATP-binding protein [Stellaceae bacterium]|nr:ABC transporter ATP-binding protein [Stellaceae bacterium]
MNEPLLALEGLSVAYRAGAQVGPVLRNISFTMSRGEVLGIVGESGSGKSTLLFTIVNYLPANAMIEGGIVRFNGHDLLCAAPDALRATRGRRIAMVYQDPATGLNPAMRVGAQIAEVRRQHFAETGSAARRRAAELLGEVGIDAPQRIAGSYPHQLSGGQQQRVMIAMALAGEPELVLMDEPTTALDVLVQARLLDLIGDLKQRFGLSVLFVSHDLGAVAAIADRIGVLYAGELMELGPAREVLERPATPYTRALIMAIPRIDAQTPARSISGHVPAVARPNDGGAPLLQVTELSVRYRHPRLWRGGPSATVQAVKRVSFRLEREQVLAIVGESGSGKTTVARTLLRLLRPHAGTVVVDGEDLSALSSARLRRLRRQVQIVFQNPTSSLNPRKTVLDLVARPLRLAGASSDAAQADAAAMLGAVGLGPEFLKRWPHQLSGGEKQRVAIARAFVTGPKLVILDEPTTSLDVLVQAAILELLERLKRERRCSYLLITHDLAVVRHIADHVVVLRAGEVCESGTVAAVFSKPRHSYTKALLDAARHD